jgi:predicted RNase H-like HicB family nuclease
MTKYIYEVVVAPDEEDPRYYNVTVPDLEGCLTFGESVKDALTEADDALKTYVAALLKFDDPVPEPVFGHEAPKGGMVVALAFDTDAGYIVEETSPPSIEEHERFAVSLK